MRHAATRACISSSVRFPSFSKRRHQTLDHVNSWLIWIGIIDGILTSLVRLFADSLVARFLYWFVARYASCFRVWFRIQSVVRPGPVFRCCRLRPVTCYMSHATCVSHVTCNARDTMCCARRSPGAAHGKARSTRQGREGQQSPGGPCACVRMCAMVYRGGAKAGRHHQRRCSCPGAAFI